MIKAHPIKDGLASILWLASIIYLAWIPGQGDFYQLLPAFIIGFTSYAYLAFNSKDKSFQFLIFVAVVGRIAVVGAFPNLSDDIYRFIWDGYLWHEGLHPFAHLPSEVVGSSTRLTQDLYDDLNSQGYYSIYPPVAQLIFWLATAFDGMSLQGSALIMKAIHCVFDIGVLSIMYRLLKKLSLPRSLLFLYAFNPLIIIELIANLHHEGIVIFFVMLCLLMMIGARTSYKYIVAAGMAISCAIATKILPILFCPLLFFYLKGKKRWIFFSVTVVTTFLLFLPLLSDMTLLENLSSSADLYLRKFEFNGGIYYISRYIGYVIYGYNKIGFLGPFLMTMSALCILYISIIPLRKEVNIKGLILLMMLTYASYVLLSITVHPWYIALLIPLCIYTSYRSPLLWSGLILMTYINYSFEPYQEMLWVVAIEYLLFYLLLSYEAKKHNLLADLRP